MEKRFTIHFVEEAGSPKYHGSSLEISNRLRESKFGARRTTVIDFTTRKEIPILRAITVAKEKGFSQIEIDGAFVEVFCNPKMEEIRFRSYREDYSEESLRAFNAHREALGI